MKPSFIYLAPASPRREQLLQQIGADFRLLLPDAAEDAEALELLALDAQELLRVRLASLQRRHR